MKDYRFQGKVYAGLRNADGSPGSLAWLGDDSVLALKPSVEKDTRKESYSGKSLLSVDTVKGIDTSFDLTLNYFSKTTLALALQSTPVDVTTGSASAEPLPINVAAGDIIALDYKDVSSVVLTGADGATLLVEGTDYSIESAAGGLLAVIDPTNFNNGAAGPPQATATAAYTYADQVLVVMFNADPPERYIVFDGVNTVTGETVRIELFRCKFEPTSQLDVISDSLSDLKLAGSILYDSVNAANANLGGFGRISLPPEV